MMTLTGALVLDPPAVSMATATNRCRRQAG